jgi:hypothetical protein
MQAEFAELQARLRALWPNVTLRSIGDVERTVVVVHSLSLEVPDHLIPTFPAYEERFLCLVLSLLKSPRSRVIYVTSQPVLPRLLDYYFGLVPEIDTAEARSRFVTISLCDGRNRPLSRKLLERPGAVARIKALIGDPDLGMLLPFATSEAEVELAVQLGIPLFGSHPDQAWLGTKKGSRRLFLEEGVPHPRGLEIDSRRYLQLAGRELDGVTRAIVKLDRGISGLGNAWVDLARVADDLEGALALEDTELSVPDYLAGLDDQGGIVEELVQGEDFRSPSAQLRMSPAGQVDILSTHDQVLGGPHGQTYFGCHFPADAEYAPRLAAEGLKVGRRLAQEGVIGRAAVDFVAVREADGWLLQAVEINLRCGGTTPSVLRAPGAHGRRLRPARRRVPDPARRPEVLRRHRSPRLARLRGADARRPAGRGRRARARLGPGVRDRGRPAHGQRARSGRQGRADRGRRHARGRSSELLRGQVRARRHRGRPPWHARSE